MYHAFFKIVSIRKDNNVHDVANLQNIAEIDI